MDKKKSLILRILVGFVAGTLLGLALCEWCTPETRARVLPVIDPFGSVLVAMLKMVVYPIILFSLICGAASMPLRQSGRVGAMVMGWYFATSLFATLFGVALAYLMNPSIAGGESVAAGYLDGAKAITGDAAGAGGAFSTFLVGLFQNPFAALASGQFLPIIVFAVAFGLAARCLMDENSPAAASVRALIGVLDGAQHAVFRLIDWVMLYFPIGVFALSAANFARNGTLLFGPYLRITVCVAVGVLAMMFIVYPVAVVVFCRENPLRVLRRIRPAMLTAFVTRSSAATLPVSFRAMDALGVSRSLSSFSLPMGATVNMDGVCVHLPVFVILAVNLFGRELGVAQVATLCLSIMFASIGTGGIPGGSVFLLFMVLESMGLAPDQVSLVVALALGINPILDMFETSCNVTGDNVCTYIVARKNGMIAAAPEG
jgi:Na+/H+-dicarboxylate symporter